MTAATSQTFENGQPVPVGSGHLVRRLSPTMEKALADIRQHGDVEAKDWRAYNPMGRVTWKRDGVTAQPPFANTCEALRRRGYLECYGGARYCGHGEYDTWQCWRLAQPTSRVLCDSCKPGGFCLNGERDHCPYTTSPNT